jgi:hypothetical protein
MCVCLSLFVTLISLLSRAITTSFPIFLLILISSLDTPLLIVVFSQELMEHCFKHLLLLHLQSVVSMSVCQVEIDSHITQQLNKRIRYAQASPFLGSLIFFNSLLQLSIRSKSRITSSSNQSIVVQVPVYRKQLNYVQPTKSNRSN